MLYLEQCSILFMKGMKNKVKMNRQMRRHFQKNSDKETNKQKMRFQNRETTLISGDMRKNFDKNFISLVLRNMSYYIYSMDIDVLLSSSLKNLYNFILKNILTFKNNLL